MRKYQSYKSSGVEWIGDIPSNWNVTKIKYTKKDTKDSFIDGDWIESKDLCDEGIRYITSGNIGEGIYKEQGKGYISEDTFNKLNCTEIFEGDLIISRLFLPVGRSCILPNLNNRVVTCVDNVVLRPKESLNKFYLNYQFNSNRYSEFTELISRGVTLTRISRGMLGNNSIVIPPLNEQLQIVQFLDEKTELIDKLISTKERKISLLKEQRISLINQVVTKGLNPNVKMKDSGVEWIGEIPEHWSNPKLSYLLMGITDGTHGTHDRVNLGKLLLSGKNVTNQGVKIGDNESQISIEEHENIVKKGYPNKGDILLTVVGSIGRSCVYEFDFPISFQRSVCFLRFGNKINDYFMNYQIQSDLIQFQLLINTKTSTQGGIYMNDLKRIDTVLPPISEQQKIVEYLDSKTKEIDELVDLEQKKIDLLKEYRQSLISEVVTGKIKVTN